MHKIQTITSTQTRVENIGIHASCDSEREIHRVDGAATKRHRYVVRNSSSSKARERKTYTIATEPVISSLPIHAHDSTHRLNSKEAHIQAHGQNITSESAVERGMSKRERTET